MIEALLPLMSFAFVSSITPGPNNIMLTSSGIWFGFRRSLPHMLGITFGFGVLLAVCAFGIGELVVAVPQVVLLLKALGCAYLLYLAWQLRRMAVSGAGERAVNELAHELGMTQPGASKHLRVLREVGLVRDRKAGKQRLYGLDARGLRPVHEWTGGFERFWNESFDRLDAYVQDLEQARQET